MQDNIQHELLLAFNSHGLSAHEWEGVVVVPAAKLRVEGQVTPLPASGGKHLVRIDVATHSARVGATPIIESFAGFGDSHQSAIGAAFGKFLIGTFHVLIESLGHHSCPENQGDWLSWKSEQENWNVCCGPVVRQSAPEGEHISEQCRVFFNALEPLFLSKATTGPHWIRVFVANFQGHLQSVEVLFDNETWPEGEALGRSWDWIAPQSYASARLFAVAVGH